MEYCIKVGRYLPAGILLEWMFHRHANLSHKISISASIEWIDGLLSLALCDEVAPFLLEMNGIDSRPDKKCTV